MGGVGSGGGNRISPQEHIRRGTYRKSRHANLARIVPLATAVAVSVPPTPPDLGQAGADAWSLVWSKWALLREELDYGLVLDYARSCDDHEIARRRYAATTEPADARAVEATARVKARWLSLLGIGPKDRAALGLMVVEGTSKLDALRRKP